MQGSTSISWNGRNSKRRSSAFVFKTRQFVSLAPSSPDWWSKGRCMRVAAWRGARPLHQTVDPGEPLAATALGWPSISLHQCSLSRIRLPSPFVLRANATRRRRRKKAAKDSASQEPNAEVALVGGGEDGVMPVGERSAGATSRGSAAAGCGRSGPPPRMPVG